MKKLHAQIDEIRSMLVGASAARPVAAPRIIPELAAVSAKLLASEVDPALSKDIVDRLQAEMATDVLFQRPGSGRLEVILRTEMQRRVRLEARLGAVVALIGPSGAGKTITIMKLAASSLTSGRPVRIVSLDDPRTAGPMQLEAFAAELNIPFTAAPEPIAETGDELVLIDTPSALEAEALAEFPELDVHLVVPGYMKAADLRQCIQKYRIFRPAKLLVTKLDETQAFGSVFSEASRAGLALSFLAHGPAIPDHLRRAGVEDLVALALDRRKTRAQVA